MSTQVTVPVAPQPPSRPAGNAVSHLRWGICGLLFFATTINYMDRQVISLLKPVLEKDLGWSEANYGWIVFAFQAAYGAMMPLAGRIIDALGTRLGYLIAVACWSAAAAAHALAGSAMQFGIARFALGIGESPNFPAALKTVATWFPVRQRALATGLFNSGANVGAIVAPLAVPWMAVHYGWRSAFIVTGGAGFVWIIVWWIFYREPWQHARLSASERSIIDEGRDMSAFPLWSSASLTPTYSRPARRGLISSASSSPTPSGGSTFSGFPAFSIALTGSISLRLVSRSSSSIRRPRSVPLEVAGSLPRCSGAAGISTARARQPCSSAP